MSNHTPTPWTSRYSNISAGDKLIGTLSSGLKAPTAIEAEANAAHIVKCVNEHDKLVKVLRFVLADLNSEIDYETRLIVENILGSEMFYAVLADAEET